MEYEDLLKEIKEYEDRGMNVNFYREVAGAIDLMSKQLSEDKALFSSLIGINLKLTEEINTLVLKHSKQFEEFK